MQHDQNDQILPIGFPILMILLTQKLSKDPEKEALAHVGERFGGPHLSQRRQWPVSIGAAVPKCKNAITDMNLAQLC
jgi:hypothetical protein